MVYPYKTLIGLLAVLVVAAVVAVAAFVVWLWLGAPWDRVCETALVLAVAAYVVGAVVHQTFSAPELR